MICELCGQHTAVIKATEQKRPKRIVMMCAICYEGLKPIYKKPRWKIESIKEQVR